MRLREKILALAGNVVDEFLDRNDREQRVGEDDRDSMVEQVYQMLDGAVGDFEILAKNGPAETISERWLDRP